MAVGTQPFTGTYVADPHHSSVVFSVRHMSVSTFRASFEDVEARLAADESGVALDGRARVDSISITNPPEFRQHVVDGEDFFDAHNHPEIGFRSSRVEFGADGSARLEGELTIKGISNPVTAIGTYRAPVEDPFGAARAALEVHSTVDRRLWDLNWQMPLPKGGDALGYEVELTVHLELVEAQ